MKATTKKQKAIDLYLNEAKTLDEWFDRFWALPFIPEKNKK